MRKVEFLPTRDCEAGYGPRDKERKISLVQGCSFSSFMMMVFNMYKESLNSVSTSVFVELLFFLDVCWSFCLSVCLFCSVGVLYLSCLFSALKLF